MPFSSPNGHQELQSPGAGPSRVTRSDEEESEDNDRDLFLRRRADYLQLEHSVESSNELLTSLASYLSIFQNDLSAVSGQIADLQERSAGIEARLKGRKTILPPLNALLTDITLPPALVLILRDTQPSQNPDLWLAAIIQLEDKINATRIRRRVQAAHEIDQVIEGLRMKALAQLPAYLLSLIRPLRSASKGLSTNLAVLQTSLLLKYQPFYRFLLRQSPRLAKKIERAYVNAARAYYETGLRRYTRALGQIKSRTVDRSDLIGVVSNEAAQAVLSKTPPGIHQAYERLKYADLGEGTVILAYMADDKDFRTPIEALYRSLGLVLMDNASAEFTFIVRFFGRATRTEANLESPNILQHIGVPDPVGSRKFGIAAEGETMREAERIWKEVFETALDSCSAFFSGMLSPPPPAVPLLTLIRLNDRLLATCESRGTLPLIPFLQAHRLAMWPMYRKDMDQHIHSLKRLADEAEGRGLTGLMGKGVKDGTVRQVASRYAALFSCVTALSEEAEEAMIFSSMTRLRGELVRLAQTQAGKIKSLRERHMFLSSLYEIIMHELVSGPGQTTHPKLQAELSFFRTREEEARRRISVT